MDSEEDLAFLLDLSGGIGIVQPFVLLEFAVRTVKSVLALLSAIGRTSIATRWFGRVQL